MILRVLQYSSTLVPGSIAPKWIILWVLRVLPWYVCLVEYRGEVGRTDHFHRSSTVFPPSNKWRNCTTNFFHLTHVCKTGGFFGTLAHSFACLWRHMEFTKRPLRRIFSVTHGDSTKFWTNDPISRPERRLPALFPGIYFYATTCWNRFCTTRCSGPSRSEDCTCPGAARSQWFDCTLRSQNCKPRVVECPQSPFYHDVLDIEGFRVVSITSSVQVH